MFGLETCGDWCGWWERVFRECTGVDENVLCRMNCLLLLVMCLKAMWMCGKLFRRL